MSSSSNPDVRLHRAAGWILGGTVLLSVFIYLLASRLYFQIGFPLDDAWIHQTYARNLVLYREWAFLPGHPSGGSTSPLWSGLLAIGYLLHLAPYLWTYVLGACGLWAGAMLAETTVRVLVPDYRSRFPWVGILLALEWHLVWAALSGMETMLYGLLVISVMALLVRRERKPLGLGILIGLSVWVRPDGITLLAPAAVALLLGEDSWPRRIRALVNLGVGCGGLAALYLFFNLLVAGSPLPNTFFAKQAEYAVYQQIPFVRRLVEEALPPLVGVGVALLPGAALALIAAVRRRAWGILACVAWYVGDIGMYAWRLPVTYQHGRYLIPAMPVLFVVGMAGFVEFIARKKSSLQWVVSRGWGLAAGLILLIFWGMGAFAYAQDVAVIDSEMVATARWVAKNVPPGALVAAHDIGALGYFGGHDLVDLAGLVNPEVIPFITDQARIEAYLNERRVAYLVTFPSWYPLLTHGLHPVFTTGAPYAPSQGGENMAVYLWPGR